MMGFLNVLKPPGMTSHDVVGWLRRQLGRNSRVGHLGTLDPAAAGVLPLALGAATRWIQYLPPARKAYRAEITFGLETDTLDATGTVLQRYPAPDPGPLDELLSAFLGVGQQVPPVVSALRVEGRRSYVRARQGRGQEPPAREVEIFHLEPVGREWPRLWLDVECGPGTYVRSLARDLGRRLGCGAVLSFLVRTASGPFRLEHALTLEEVRQRIPHGLAEVLWSTERALAGLPVVEVRANLMPGQENEVDPPLPTGTVVCLRDPDRGYLGVGRIAENGRVRMERSAAMEPPTASEAGLEEADGADRRDLESAGLEGPEAEAIGCP